MPSGSQGRGPVGRRVGVAAPPAEEEGVPAEEEALLAEVLAGVLDQNMIERKRGASELAPLFLVLYLTRPQAPRMPEGPEEKTRT